MTELAIFDLDGTIVPVPEGAMYRENFVWDKFLAIMDDQPAFQSILSTVLFHRMMKHKVVVVTARPESERQRTIALLDNVGFEFDELIMRPNEMIEEETKQLEEADDSEIKGILFNNHANWRKGVRELFINRGDNISYAYDDQMPNLSIWREAGCSVWLMDKDGHLAGAA